MEEIRELFLRKAAEKEARKMAMKLKLGRIIPAPFAPVLNWLMNITGK